MSVAFKALKKKAEHRNHTLESIYIYIYRERERERIIIIIIIIIYIEKNISRETR